MNIKRYNKAEIFSELYNGSKPLGLGVIEYNPSPMTKEEAQSILEECGANLYFDYLKGRVMKVDLSGDELDLFLYDRDNGEGKARSIIEKLKRI